MIETPFYVHINLNGNEIRNVKVEQLNSHPLANESRLYYNTVDKTVYFYNGTNWIDIGGSGTVQGIEVAGGILSIGEVDGVFTITLNANSINHSAINDDQSEKHRLINDAGNNTTDLLSAQKILQLFAIASSSGEWFNSVKSIIVDNTIPPPSEVDDDRYLLSSTGGVPHADWDGASAGDVVEFHTNIWIAEIPTIGVHVGVDDDNAGVYLFTGTIWQKQEWENTPDATEAVKGKIAIATQAEIETRLDNNKAITPLGLTLGKISRNDNYLVATTDWVANVPGWKVELTHPGKTTGKTISGMLVQCFENGISVIMGIEITTTLITIHVTKKPLNSILINVSYLEN